MNVQVIMKEGRPEWAVIPYADYETLLQQLEQAKKQLGIMHAQRADTAAGTSVATPMPVATVAQATETSKSAVVASSLGERLQRLREQLGLDLASVAQGVGISAAYLQQMEQGEREPSEPILRNLAKTLGVSQDQLTG